MHFTPNLYNYEADCVKYDLWNVQQRILLTYFILYPVRLECMYCMDGWNLTDDNYLRLFQTIQIYSVLSNMSLNTGKQYFTNTNYIR